MFSKSTEERFAESLYDLYEHGRKMAALYIEDTGDDSRPPAPEFKDLPPDLRGEWIMLAGPVSMMLTDLTHQIGAIMATRSN